MLFDIFCSISSFFFFLFSFFSASYIVKKETRRVKKKYEIKVANHVETDPKSFIQIYKTKNRESIGPFKIIQGDTVSSDEEMGKNP